MSSLSLYAAIIAALAVTLLATVDSFQLERKGFCRRSFAIPKSKASSTALNNFLKDVFGAAFENDSNLSQNNKRAGMLDAAVGGDDDDGSIGRQPQLTSTQQAWRQKMMPSRAVTTADIEGTAIAIDMFLTGVPSRDPTNDLYGKKTNISSRDRVVGQILPMEPTVGGVQVLFQANQKCAIRLLSDDDDNSDDKNDEGDSGSSNGSGFCKTDQLGDWKLSDGEGDRQIRFRIAVTGYMRTVQTKGTIQKIYWSSQDESTTQTSTTYSIPEGWLYFEADVSVNKAPGRPVQWSDGVVKVEQSMGLLGAASRMIPCGKFTSRPL